MLNGSSVSAKITAGKVIDNWIKKEKMSPEEVIDRIYLRCLTRPATDEERKTLMAKLGDDKNKIPALQDIFWAVLNSREFVFNH